VPITVLNAKPTNKDQRLSDGGGLYLLIKSNGSKGWRLDTASMASAKPYHWVFIQSPA
jgi:hypothetical protein